MSAIGVQIALSETQTASGHGKSARHPTRQHVQNAAALLHGVLKLLFEAHNGWILS